MGFKVINGSLKYIQDYSVTSTNVPKKSTNLNGKDFKTLLKDQFTISKHAADRLKTRDINFTKEDMKVINNAINKADKKGSRECLIVYKEIALVTSIKNRTVITAMGKEDSKENIFTNIDSAILL